MRPAARPLALITGASAGIGAELARVFARNGHDLVLVARRKERLDALAVELAKHQAQVVTIACDLTHADAVANLASELESRSLTIDVLINNAGITYAGEFSQMSQAAVANMLQLNMVALVQLTHRLLPAMIAHRAGRILNVASLSAFQPVPMMTLYAATKVFVMSFTEGLAEELKGTGITATALCPGLTATDMVGDATGGTTGLPEVPEIFLADVASVAHEGYIACMAGEVVRVPGVANRMAAFWSSTTPRWLVRSLSGLVSRQLLRR